MKQQLLAACMLAVFALSVGAQTTSSSPSSSTALSPLSFEMVPSVLLPLGEGAQYFTLSGSVDAQLRYRLARLPLSLLGGASYSFVPVISNESISIAAAELGAAVELPLTSAISVEGYARGGYWVGSFNNVPIISSHPMTEEGATVHIRLGPRWNMGVGALYRCYFGLYQGVGFRAAATLSLPTKPQNAARASSKKSAPSIQPLSSTGASRTTKDGIDLATPDFPPIFPVFYKYYDNHPIGTIELINRGKTPISNVTASVYIKQYMDNPKECPLTGTIAPGQSQALELYALFNDAVLSITEGTKVSAEILLSYEVAGRQLQERSVQTLRFLNRNAMTWDDNRRPAAFITAMDPAVLTFSKSVTGLIRSKEVRSINASLQTAIALHEALDLYGVNYVTDPTTPFTELSQKTTAVDFLQFPRQTLQYRAGDCDDLSILYSSLLEAVGLHAALVTTPGHIFVAVDTGLSAKAAAEMLIPADQVIVHGATAWIPVEITLRHQGFLKAWETGAKEWHEAEPLGRAGFYPVEEAWTAFEPVGLPGSTEISVPQSDVVVAAYLSEVMRYVDQAIFPAVAALQAQIRSTGSLNAMNKLGVLYAKYGQPEKARVEFTQILKSRGNYLPALLNLGNMAYLEEDWLSAQRYYGQASDVAPNNSHVLLAVARVNQQLENYGNVKRSYLALQKTDPALAQQYGYLGLGAKADSSRAADVTSQKEDVVWEEE